MLENDPDALCGLGDLGFDAMDEIKGWSKNFGTTEKNAQNASALDILEELPPGSLFSKTIKEILVYAVDDESQGHGTGRGFVGKQSWGPRYVHVPTNRSFCGTNPIPTPLLLHTAACPS
jgi:hypothetical protein